MRLPPIVLAIPLVVAACGTSDNAPMLPGSVDAPPPPIAPASDAGDALLATGIWVWQGSVMADGTRVVPDTPARYTLAFEPGGRVNVQADCNRGSGGYLLNGSTLTFGPIAVTRAACPPGSKDSEFLKGLAEVRGHRDDGGELVLMLSGNAGSMRFRSAGR